MYWFGLLRHICVSERASELASVHIVMCVCELFNELAFNQCSTSLNWILLLIFLFILSPSFSPILRFAVASALQHSTTNELNFGNIRWITWRRCCCYWWWWLAISAIRQIYTIFMMMMMAVMMIIVILSRGNNFEHVLYVSVRAHEWMSKREQNLLKMINISLKKWFEQQQQQKLGTHHFLCD